MKGLIKNFVLLTLLLQLCVSVQIVKGQTVGQPRAPEFGDLFRFDRKLPCTDIALYSHYAIYVGNTPIDGKQPDEDIFEMTKVDGTSGCRFSKLQERPTIYNYKDDTLDKKSDEEIKKMIVDMKQKCGKWSFKNTCEHVATQARYGEAHRQCNQQTTLIGPICTMVKTFKNFIPRGKRSKYLRPAAAAA